MDVLRQLEKDTMRTFVGLLKEIVGERWGSAWMMTFG